MPFFGIPIRNGLPIGLGSVAGFGVAPEFSPADLFLGGVNGAWYDPSDSTTLFSDTAGTTPVAQPGAGAQVVVGLMLDKSQNGVGTNGAKRLNLLTYSEQFDNAAWAQFNAASDIVANATTAPNGTNTADFFRVASTTNTDHLIQQTSLVTVVPGTFILTWRVKPNGITRLRIAVTSTPAPSFTNRAWVNTDLSNLTQTSGVDGVNFTVVSTSVTPADAYGFHTVSLTYTTTDNFIRAYMVMQDASGNFVFAGSVGTGLYIWGADLRLASEASTAPTYQPITSSWYATEAGNHAISYNSTTARPELSARVNLLTYSEQFDNGVWDAATYGASVSANTTTAPDGSLTADTLTENTANSTHLIRTTAGTFAYILGVSYTQSWYVKSNGRNKVAIYFPDLAFPGTARSATYDLVSVTATVNGASGTASIQSVGSGWFRCVYTQTADASASDYSALFALLDASGNLTYTGDGTSGVYIWGAQLIQTNAFPANTYQRIADQYTYDNSASFPRYLRFDGVDDGMSTPANLNLSSTDKATVFAGVRKLSDAAGGVVTELSASVVNPGTFLFTASPSATARYQTAFSDSASLCVYQPQTFTAPISNVIDASFDLSAGSISTAMIPRVNGVVKQDNPTGTKSGSGNFVSAPLNIGARNVQSGTPTAATFFNGNIYSLIVRGAATNASTISATETWVANETGISIFDNGPSLGLDFTAQTYQVWEV